MEENKEPKKSESLQHRLLKKKWEGNRQVGSAQQQGEDVAWYKRIQELKGIAKCGMHEWLLGKGWKWNDYEETYSDGKPFGESMDKTEAWSYFLDENKLGWDDDEYLLSLPSSSGDGQEELWEEADADLLWFCRENGYISKPLQTVMPMIIEHLKSKYHITKNKKGVKV